tara:strand:+ start:222 stop:800 length:579 start_codon:yes stop_codon:yes gene_type:complete
MNFIDLQNYGVVEHQLPNKLLLSLKKQVKKIMKNKPTMYSNLIGNKPPHYFLTDTKELANVISETINAYNTQYNYIPSYTILTKSVPLTFDKPWVNSMSSDQYISNHTHDGVYSYSCWIDVPYKTIFEFSYSNILGTLVRKEYTIDKSYEGRIFLFPSLLTHCTYTLEKSKKKRLCISGNVSFNTDHKTVCK